MRILFFTFYYPPDLCAGSFRAVALVKALSSKLLSADEIHVITTHPHRYTSHKVIADDVENYSNVIIHRIQVFGHQSRMVDQVRAFVVFAYHALHYCRTINPDFIIGTTSRLMTGVLTWFSSIIGNCGYFIDLRDIFSETISDIISVKSPFIGRPLRVLFSFVERYIFFRARGINVVSEGFPGYFREHDLDTSHWTFFPNGVDREFINRHLSPMGKKSAPKTVLYVGNIGRGQGLETIIPYAAQRLGGAFKFQIVGDGGTRKLLEEKIATLGVYNVELLPPVGREKLILYYEQADILFLHLHKLSAFKRVLPSKIFEYAALGKPIVAGLNGYSAQFIAENVMQASLFKPGDIDGCVASLQKAATCDVDLDNVQRFVKKYSRDRIMDKMAAHILSLVSRTI